MYRWGISKVAQEALCVYVGAKKQNENTEWPRIWQPAFWRLQDSAAQHQKCRSMLLVYLKLCIL